MRIGIFDCIKGTNEFDNLEQWLNEVCEYRTESYDEPLDGLESFAAGKYSMILLKGCLCTERRDDMHSSIITPKDLSIYLVTQLRNEDDNVPIVVLCNVSKPLLKEAYIKAGATACVNYSMRQAPEDLVNAISKASGLRL
jgi:hypothetical protein